MNTLITANKLVLNDKRFIAVLFILSVLFLFLLIYLPVITIPGNDLPFQLGLFTKADYLILLLVAFVSSWSVTLNIYSFFQKRDLTNNISTAGKSTLNSIIGVSLSIFAVPKCLTCVSLIFGFLGLGSILFLIQYRLLISAFLLVILLISVYLTASKILGNCRSCRL